MTYTYQYARPGLTVDSVVFGWDGSDQFQLLLIQRDQPPFEGQWAFPGGFLEIGETLREASERELMEETSVNNVSLEQFYVFDDPDRDPRERVITVAFVGLVRSADHKPKAASDARRAAWLDITRLPKLAFDHAEILARALDHIQMKASAQPSGWDSLPDGFPLEKLIQLGEGGLNT